MCGIAGYVGLESGDGSEAVLRRMARQLEHRGPDGEGIVRHGRVGLAHRRLAVIDPAGGAQPMRSPDGRHVIVYNGAVYNYRELRQQLAGHGHRFVTNCDTEVVLAAWRQWGEGAFDRFNGMFALAILDTSTGELVLARDQFGIKPLYLASDDAGRVAFGSEIRAVLAAGVVPRRPDDLTIYRYLRFRVHDDTERTFFDRVRRLLPGELAVISPDGKVNYRTYTRLYLELDWLAARPRPYDAEACEEVRAELHAAIRRRLVSDVPIGTALSGGLDSSTVVATVNQLLGERDAETDAVGTVQRSFSAVFPGERNDEERYVDVVATGCARQLEVHKVYPNPEQFLTDLPDFVRTQEEPVISTGPYAQYCVMRQAGQHVRVMLDGQGADEMLAGYLPYFLVQLQDIRRRQGILPAGWEMLRSLDMLWRMGRFQVLDLLHRRRRIPVNQLLAPEFTDAWSDQRLDVVGDDLKRRLSDDLFRHSLPALLRYEDRNTMRFSVEGRVPFLDPNLLRLIWSLEPAAIISGGWNKRALRDATVDLLPPMVNQRRDKIGFTTPEDAWFERIQDMVGEVFRSESFINRPYLRPAAVNTALQAYRSGRARAETMLFWRLLNLELWLREMIDRDPTRPPASTFTEHYPQQRAEVAAVGGDGAVTPAPSAEAITGDGAVTSADGMTGVGAATRPTGVPPADGQVNSDGTGDRATNGDAAPTDRPLLLVKPDWLPNQDKRLVSPDQRWARFPLQTPLVRSGDDIPHFVAQRVARFFEDLAQAPAEVFDLVADHRWYLYLSEKVVAIAQGRSFFTWEIEPSWWARKLSRFVLRTPYGIGLGDPTTMQLAIDEVGLPRILAASAVSVAGKAVGRRGLFYRVTGPQVAAIDGPTHYSAYPANVSAKLAPANPDRVAQQVSQALRATLPTRVAERYGGAVVIDANDIGRNVLGHDTGLPPALLADAFADNPLGQGREQTPVGVVFALTPAGRHQRRSSFARTSESTSPTSRTPNSTANPR